MAEKAKSSRKKRSFALGLVIIIFALIGVIAVVWWSVGRIAALTDKSRIYAEYEDFLMPVVMNDPDPFDDISGANMEQLIDCSIWALVTDELNPNAYDYYESESITGIIVPQEDVEAQFERLFGTEIKPVHCDVVSSSYKFLYIPGEGQYIVPLTGVSATYLPKVMKIDKKGNSTMLTVAYYYENDSTLGAEQEIEPVKYMKITLRNSAIGYYIGALQSTDALEIASTTKPASQATDSDLPAIVTEASTAPETTVAPITTAAVTTAPETEAED